MQKSKNTERRAEICQMMTLGTAHLRPATRTALEDEADTNRIGLTVYTKDEFGWFIYIDDTAMTAADLFTLNNDFPDLEDCIVYAKENGCQILCFDCDAEPCDALPVYND